MRYPFMQEPGGPVPPRSFPTCANFDAGLRFLLQRYPQDAQHTSAEGVASTHLYLFDEAGAELVVAERSIELDEREVLTRGLALVVLGGGVAQENYNYGTAPATGLAVVRTDILHPKPAESEFVERQAEVASDMFAAAHGETRPGLEPAIPRFEPKRSEVSFDEIGGLRLYVEGKAMAGEYTPVDEMTALHIQGVV